MQQYTVFDISAMFNVNTETVRRWIRSGELKATKMSKKKGYMIMESDVEEFRNNRPKWTTRQDHQLNTDIILYKQTRKALMDKLEKLIKEREYIDERIAEITTLLEES